MRRERERDERERERERERGGWGGLRNGLNNSHPLITPNAQHTLLKRR